MCYKTVDKYTCGHQGTKVASCDDDPTVLLCPEPLSAIEFDIGTGCENCVVACHVCSNVVDPKVTNCGVCGHWIADCARCWSRRASTVNDSDSDVVFIKEERVEENAAEEEKDEEKNAGMADFAGAEEEPEKEKAKEVVEEKVEEKKDEEGEKEVVVLDD
jgi:hypothetical protein